MSFESISQAILIVFDELKNNSDPEAIKIVEKIDTAEGDEAVKEGLREAVNFIERESKITLAQVIREKATGFAF